VQIFAQKFEPIVQEALLNAIAPVRQQSNNESVIQRVVRKGLVQAEELERNSKKLLLVLLHRDVTTASMMSQVLEVDIDANLASDSTDTNAHNQAKSSEVAEVKTKGNKDAKSKPQQMSLPMVQNDLPDMPPQYKDLFVALAQDINLGTKDKKEASWTNSGLAIPKKFLANYGKSVTACIDQLTALGIIISSNQKNVMIKSEIGELLIPRDN